MTLVNLHGRWRMEESSGSLLDSSAQANHLTGTWTQSATHQVGSFAASFAETKVSRANSSLTAGFPCKEGVSPTSITFGGWIRPTVLPGTVMYLCDKGGAYSLAIDANSKLSFQCANGGANPIVLSNSALVVNTWYHVACRGSTANGVMDLFVNNVKQTGSGAKSLTVLADNTTAFTLAGNSGASNNFQGLMDEWWIFDDLVSDADLTSIYTGTLFQGAYESFLDEAGPKPISWWMFEDAASPALDGNTTNNNDLTWGTGGAQNASHVQGSFSHLTGSADTLSSFANLSSNFPCKGATTDLTFGGWFRISANPSVAAAMCYFTDDFIAGGWEIRAETTGVLRCTLLNGGNNRVTTDTDVCDDTLHHFAMRWNGSGDDVITVWIDGVKDSQLPTMASIGLVTAASFRFGSLSTDNLYLDEWFIFDVALTDAQIQSIYAHGLSGTLNPDAAQLALDIGTQPSANAVSAVAFAQQPAVQLVDLDSQPVATADVDVTASIASGTGTLSGTNPQATDATGLATFTDLKITGAGVHTLRFDGTDLFGVVSDNVTVADRLSVTTQPSATVVSGVALAQQPAIQLKDPAATSVSVSGITITATKNSGPGTLGGTLTANTNASGLATFTNLTLTGPGDYVLEYTSPGLTPVQSNATAVTTTANKLAIITTPSATGISGEVLAQQPVIELQTAGSAAVLESNVTITASIATGTGTIGGTTAVTASNGRATFTALALTGVDTFTVAFATPGVTGVTSGNVVISSADPPPPVGVIGGLMGLGGSTTFVDSIT